MTSHIQNLLLKHCLALVLAVSFVFIAQGTSAEAGHKKRAAIIAGAIVGGAIAYHHYKKRKAYSRHYGYRARHYKRKHYRYHYGHVKPRYRIYRHSSRGSFAAHNSIK